MTAIVVSGCAAFWGGLLSAIVHTYPRPQPGLLGVLEVLAAYWWGALAVGVGTWLFIRIAAGFGRWSRTGRRMTRLADPTPDAGLDVVLHHARSAR